MTRPARERLTLAHHDLCFGCGIANLFGLQLELERDAGGVSGRFFMKQDHQGPPGVAHGGIVATALDEAMALLIHAEGIHALTRRLEIELLAPAPVGTFGLVSARIDTRDERRLQATAELRSREAGTERALARARGEFVLVD